MWSGIYKAVSNVTAGSSKNLFLRFTTFESLGMSAGIVSKSETFKASSNIPAIYETTNDLFQHSGCIARYKVLDVTVI